MTKDLEYKPKSCWETYNSVADREEMNTLAQRYIKFISSCKTEWETITWAVERLKEAGVTHDPANGTYCRALKGKTLFAAKRGTASLNKGLRLIAAHADTPRLDFKQRPVYEEIGMGQAKTHYYGGIRKHQWMARALALHGLVAREDGSFFTFALGEDPADPVFTIADLLPHLAQKQAEKPLKDAFEAEKMNVILGHQPLDKPADAKESATDSKDAAKDNDKNEDAPKDPVKAHVLKLLNERFSIREEDLQSSEIHAVPAGVARRVGLDNAMIGGYGQDDRICVFLAVEAMVELAQRPSEHTQVVILWDKEEIGSEGATGAKSRFMEYCVRDLMAAWDPDAVFGDIMQNTKALSADVNAALDPDYPDVHERLNSALLGYGPAMSKFTGHRGKYESSDATAQYVAFVRNLLNRENIPWQLVEMGRVDNGGGGTVAMHLANYGMDVIDMGPSVLSMHSPFELTSIADLYATLKAFSAFLKS